MSESRKALTSRVIRYGAAGVFATAVYFAALYVFVEVTGVAPVPSAVLATIVNIVTSYVVNRRWVFDTDRSHASSFTRFVIASLLSIGLNTGIMYVATVVFAWPWIAGAAITTLVVPPVNFVVNYFWAFRPTSNERG